MTSDELKAIEQRAEAATPGPWEQREDGDYYQGGTYIGVGPSHFAEHISGRYNELVPGRGEGPFDTYFKQDVCRVEGSAEDLEFLLHVRTDVPALIAEVRRLQALLPKLEGLTFELRGETVVVEYHRPEYGPIRPAALEDACVPAKQGSDV